MGIQIRRAILDSDREILVAGLLKHLTPFSDGNRYDWLYLRNPDGPAQVWLARDESNGDLIGSAAAIPRRMFVSEREVLGCVLMDFWVHPKYRSLGPSLQLQRACMSSIGPSGPFVLCYDLPSAAMIAIYKRLNVAQNEQLIRIAKPLRVDRWLAKILKFDLLTRRVSAVANRIFALRDIKIRKQSSAQIAVEGGELDEEFSSLAPKMAIANRICVARTNLYLNWRFLQHYRLRYELVTARSAGKLLAYVLIGVDGGIAEIADVVGGEDSGVLSDLIGEVVRIFRARGVEGISFQLSPSHPCLAVLNRMGFYNRESTPIISYLPPSDQRNVGSGYQWCFSQGDWP